MATLKIVKELHPGVAQAFWEWLEGVEGDIPFMYLDNNGYVTIGRGFLIEDNGELAEDWRNPALYRPRDPNSSVQVTRAMIEAEFARVKGIWREDRKRVEAKKIPDCKFTKDRRGQPRNTCEVHLKPLCQRGTRLRLDAGEAELELLPAAMSNKFLGKVAENVRFLLSSRGGWFRAFARYPADAQLALMELAWGVPGALKSGVWINRKDNTIRFDFRRLNAACQAWDFATAARESRKYSVVAKSATARSRGRQTMFLNAACVLYDVIENESDRDVSQVVFPEAEPRPEGFEDGWKPAPGWQPPSGRKAKAPVPQP
jgi:hypothetical protein